ncbi:hypothetical protein Q7C36_003641 [Tachysurus vachellii]|uniref:MORN repeat-containing protein 3 n=1 Tax=Tachysurus vachellii TaxID=175792 RepID=A0AA88NVD4_TACVA|nr:MORN repeat-containing protein 3-like [Tachysurus vachellii]KAK2864487.1 hypothetical protein Q7C36_003641 [Tachysurus vachellii]
MALLGKLKSSELRCERMGKRAQRNGLCHTVRKLNGDLYTGEWKDDLRHGRGTQVWKKAKAMYEGEWAQDARHGHGTLYKLQPSGEYLIVYTGSWVNGKRDGFGKCFYSSSAQYEGEWVQNIRSGWGWMQLENGDVYEGEWLRDKPHGHGALLLSNGNRYEGGIKDGKKHGHGRFFYKDRCQVYEGFWVHDAPRCGMVREDTKKPHPLSSSTFPQVMLKDAHAVLQEGLDRFYSNTKHL